jgi:hypothetical protein
VDGGLVGLAGLGALVGLHGVGGLAWRSRRLRSLDLALRLGLFIVVVVLAADRAFELADPAADGLAELGKPFRPENDESDDQDDRKLKGSHIRHRDSW